MYNSVYDDYKAESDNNMPLYCIHSPARVHTYLLSRYYDYPECHVSCDD